MGRIYKNDLWAIIYITVSMKKDLDIALIVSNLRDIFEMNSALFDLEYRVSDLDPVTRKSLHTLSLGEN